MQKIVRALTLALGVTIYLAGRASALVYSVVNTLMTMRDA